MILGTTTLRGISGPGPGLMGIAPRSAAMVPSARIFCMRSPDRRNACPGSISKTSDLSLAPPGVMMIWLSAIRCLLLHKDDPVCSRPARNHDFAELDVTKAAAFAHRI